MTKAALRICVGTPRERRSSVWKFIDDKNEIYIMTRLFAKEAKVSLHGDGRCQWSRYDSWVKAAPERRNADRHITQWRLSRPDGRVSLLAFMVQIPESELRVMGDDKGLSRVNWIGAAPAGSATTIACYLTCPTADDPSAAANLPHPHVWSARLTDGRWLVLLHVIEMISASQLEEVRQGLISSASAQQVKLLPSHRACLFAEGGGGITRSLIEIALTDA
jgi:hypothetical protein